MYAIGEKIVYPMHGTGYIEKIEQKEIAGNVADYYTIHIINGNIKLCLPVDNKAEIKLRPIAPKEEAQAVLYDFENAPVDPNMPWVRRYQANMDRLKKGDLQNVAQVVRELMVRDQTNGLSTGDRKMLMLSRGILVTELSLVLELEAEALTERLYNAVIKKLEQ